MTAGEDEFYELLGQRERDAPALLKALLRRAELLGIKPDRQSGLSLKHPAPEGNDLNLGTVTKDGYLETSPSTCWGRTENGRGYNAELASAIGGFVREMKGGTQSALRTADGKTPRLTDLLPKHEDVWLQAMERYIQRAFQQAEDAGR
jgi:hypothetical protein